MAALDNATEKFQQAANSQSADPATGLQVITTLSASGEELRILIDVAEGSGHDTTTINILKRLIDYGFRAPVTIYCGGSAKLESLLPGYRAGMKTLTYRGVPLTFVGKPAAGTPARLLICGGSDTNLAGYEKRYRDLKCAYYLQLQPWGWKSPDYLLAPGEAKKPTVEDLNNQEKLGKRTFAFSAYAQPQPQREQAVWDEYKANQKVTSVVTLAEQLDQRKDQMWTLPAYGVKRWECFLNLALAAAKAQTLMQSKGLQVKPVVLLSFGPLLEDGRMDEDDEGQPGALLTQALAGTWSKLNGVPLLKQYIESNLRDRCRVLYGDKRGEFVNTLTHLPANGILVLSMGMAPQEVFNYLYASATLPPAFEGRGTLNLMLNLGRPYLCRTFSSSGTSPHHLADYPGLNLDDDPPPVGIEMRRLASCIDSSLIQYQDPDTVKSPWPSRRLGQGLITMLTDPATKEYFAALKDVYGNRAHDRLLKALRYCAGKPGFLP
ncbi:MAG: hypothetical protein ACTHN7_05225 [Solirubrobacterales bacterium]